MFHATPTQRLAASWGLRPLMESARGVQVVVREQGERTLLFCLNHMHKDRNLIVTGDYIDLITGLPC